MWARVVLLQKVLASRVEAFSPYSLAAPQSVPTGFSPAAVGFMIVTSASVPGGWSGAGEVAGVERAGAEVGGGVVDPAVSWGLPPPGWPQNPPGWPPNPPGCQGPCAAG